MGHSEIRVLDHKYLLSIEILLQVNKSMGLIYKPLQDHKYMEQIDIVVQSHNISYTLIYF